MRLSGWLAAGLAIAAGAQQGPTFRTQTRVVEVNLVATTSKGTPVRDLTAADVRVFDDRREQAILTFEKVGENGVAGGRQEAVANGRTQRRSILLLDALNTDWSSQIYARRAAVRMLEQLPAGDRVAIFALGKRLILLHDFTSDREALGRLVRQFSGERPVGGMDSHPEGAADFRAEFSYEDLVRGPSANSGLAAALFQRNRILDTLRALSEIARRAKAIPGRKNLLWVSAGFPLTIGEQGSPQGTESFHEEAAQTTRELTAANLAIYPIDARGLSVSPRAMIHIMVMQELAEHTGGKAFYNSNDLAGEVRAALDDSRESYVLTYSPADYHEDQRFHRIQLKTTRRGVELRYRQGYYADAGRN